MSSGDCWIFGYGSLIWRPEFHFVERYPALLRGWARRFWQDSVDHRGVPGAPGRVVTLVQEADAETWGVAYRPAQDRLPGTMAELDHRERGGYARFEAPVALRDGPVESVVATVYVATESNRNYAGPAPLDDIARQIVRSVGPSGPNTAYLLELDAALSGMGVVDEHVRDLAALVRAATGD